MKLTENEQQTDTMLKVATIDRNELAGLIEGMIIALSQTKHNFPKNMGREERIFILLGTIYERANQLKN